MSRDSDVAKDMRSLKGFRKEKHQEWYDINMEILIESDIIFKDNGNTVLIREDNKPKIDFYPHTGRWKVCRRNSNTKDRFMRGGAKNFLLWYKKQ